MWTLNCFDLDSGILAETWECKNERDAVTLALELDSEFFVKMVNPEGICERTFGNPVA